MRRKFAILIVLALIGASAAAAAATEAYPWRDHAAPFDFTFVNHIDTHQQSLTKGGMLQGFFYIRFVGGVDEASGLPVAKHGNCASPEIDCEVGWVWHGVPWRAESCGHVPDQHPTWAVEGAGKYEKRGYSHFHWLGAPEHAKSLVAGQVYDGYLLRLTAIDSFFFDHHGGFAIKPGIERDSHANLVTECPA